MFGMQSLPWRPRGPRQGTPILTAAAVKLMAEASARTAASAHVQAHHSKANGPASVIGAIKAEELALRDVVVRMCSSRKQPGNRALFEASARESFGGN